MAVGKTVEEIWLVSWQEKENFSPNHAYQLWCSLTLAWFVSGTPFSEAEVV